MAPISPGAGPPPRRLLRGGERLQHIVGKRLLVGVTVREEDGTVVSRTQFCGLVLEVADGVVVVERDGEPALLPSDDLAYTSAPRGTYRLSGSGEVVEDPDYVTTWDVTMTPPAPARPDVEVDGKTEIETDVDDADDAAPGPGRDDASDGAPDDSADDVPDAGIPASGAQAAADATQQDTAAADPTGTGDVTPGLRTAPSEGAPA